MFLLEALRFACTPHADEENGGTKSTGLTWRKQPGLFHYECHGRERCMESGHE